MPNPTHTVIFIFRPDNHQITSSDAYLHDMKKNQDLLTGKLKPPKNFAPDLVLADLRRATEEWTLQTFIKPGIFACLSIGTSAFTNTDNTPMRIPNWIFSELDGLSAYAIEAGTVSAVLQRLKNDWLPWTSGEKGEIARPGFCYRSREHMIAEEGQKARQEQAA